MRVRGLLAAGAAGVVVLAGCADRQEGNDTLPTASTSAVASASLKPLGPTDLPMPAEAREKTPEGAEAFVRYYIALLNRARHDFDTSYLSQFARDCETCSTIVAGFSAYAAEGFSLNGGQISIGQISAPAVSGSEAEFVVALSQAAVSVTDSAGSPVPGASAPAGQFPGSGGLATWSLTDSSWIITQLTIL